jgi:hypothetical protein
MVSISRSMLLAASLLAFPLAGAMAQHDPSREGEGKSTDSSSAAMGDHKADSKKDGTAMKSTAPGYQDKSDVAGGVGKSPGNAATGESGKKPQ